MTTAETFVPLPDMDAWEAFWADNAECLSEQVGGRATCFAMACNQSLMVGGGAAPLFRVGFVDAGYRADIDAIYAAIEIATRAKATDAKAT